MRTRVAMRIGTILLAGVIGVASCTIGQPPDANRTAAPSPTPALTERLREASREQQNGNYEAAAAHYEAIAQAEGDPNAQSEALLQLGRCRLEAGAYPAAAESLQRYIAAYPDSPEAAIAHFWLGEALRKAGDGSGAADAYRGYLQRRPLLSDYVGERKIAACTGAGGTPAPGARPSSTGEDAEPQPSPTATPSTEDEGFQAGVARFQQGDWQAAMAAWTQHLSKVAFPPMRACLFVWLGKAAERQGNAAGAREWWAQAAAADPEGFWGLRARDLSAGRQVGGRAEASAFDPARYRPRGDRAEAEAWLAGWAGSAPDGQRLSDLPEGLARSESFRRGSELWLLGETAAATAEFNKVRRAYKDDPRALYALALYCHEQRFFRVSVVAAERVLALAPAAARAHAPRFIEELAYPAPYAELVLKEAQQQGVDPLLFFALLRKESLFDADAASAADARGLSQLMPGTAELVAAELDDDAYTPERLWRPAVNIRYGMRYLANAMRRFNGNAMSALAAYNAGPGNADEWRRAAGEDDDLFCVQIEYPETRDYVQVVYETLAQYEKLYR